ncbi:hypothetical protein PENFLA_c007G06972 [Penicillium flavigenum]|uniref:Uncharacterized protein n=1 Tax=Penicillium flavigenum TaxID=254877 RepID=A0A1V6TK11_9EURO|nr:hypothetical protein PENFLA_c007G06972 [Penicillium flavigenum]
MAYPFIRSFFFATVVQYANTPLFQEISISSRWNDNLGLQDDVAVVRYLAEFIFIDVSTRPVTIRVQHILLPFLLVALYESRQIDDGPMHRVRADPLNEGRRIA